MTQTQTQQVFHIKQHDTEPSLYFTVYDGDDPIDLTAAVVLRFLMSSIQTGVVINNTTNIVLMNQTTDKGEAEYRWQAGDTDIAGDFNAEIEITWAAGRMQTWPSKGYIKVKIAPDIA